MQVSALSAFSLCTRVREQNRARNALFRIGAVPRRTKGTLMSRSWGARWSSFLRSGKNLEMGWMLAAAIVALYLVVFRPQERPYGINNSRATGVAAVAERAETPDLWHQTRVAGIVAGVP